MTDHPTPGPDFIVIGAQKCGTTSLYRYLAGHPRVLPAAEKQLDFFAHDAYRRGTGWYLSRFPERKPGVLCGEASPYYMPHPHAAGRIREFDPKVRLVAILRNPVDRAYSHYQHQVRNHREPLPFEEALAAEEGRIGEELLRMLADGGYNSKTHRRHSYLSRGRYAEQLERWFSLFPKEQVLVLNSEAMFENPCTTLEEVTRFLGLPPLELGDYNRYMPGSYWKGMRPETREMLVRYFRPHNRRLYDLLGTTYPWDA